MPTDSVSQALLLPFQGPFLKATTTCRAHGEKWECLLPVTFPGALSVVKSIRHEATCAQDSFSEETHGNKEPVEKAVLQELQDRAEVGGAQPAPDTCSSAVLWGRKRNPCSLKEMHAQSQSACPGRQPALPCGF